MAVETPEPRAERSTNIRLISPCVASIARNPPQPTGVPSSA
jgi:hypothetical protein